jgi:hypothetical protein
VTSSTPYQLPGLPAKGAAPEEILAELAQLRGKDLPHEGGRLFSYVFDHGDADLSRLQHRAFTAFSAINMLDPTAFPSVAAMENEVIGTLLDNKSTEQLSSSDAAVRLSAIYALERLMGDSSRDQPRIVRVLSGYVRLHAQDKASGPNTDKADLAVDVRAALGVIHARRRDYSVCVRCEYQVDLSHVSFHDKNLVELDLSGVNLGGADLGGADLRYANLTGTRLNGANLGSVNLTQLDGTNPTFEAVGGVVWSRATQWPASLGGTAGMRARSVKLKKGLYKVVDRAGSVS